MLWFHTLIFQMAPIHYNCNDSPVMYFRALACVKYCTLCFVNSYPDESFLVPVRYCILLQEYKLMGQDNCNQYQTCFDFYQYMYPLQRMLLMNVKHLKHSNLTSISAGISGETVNFNDALLMKSTSLAHNEWNYELLFIAHGHIHNIIFPWQDSGILIPINTFHTKQGAYIWNNNVYH